MSDARDLIDFEMTNQQGELTHERNQVPQEARHHRGHALGW